MILKNNIGSTQYHIIDHIKHISTFDNAIIKYNKDYIYETQEYGDCAIKSFFQTYDFLTRKLMNNNDIKFDFMYPYILYSQYIMRNYQDDYLINNFFDTYKYGLEKTAFINIISKKNYLLSEKLLLCNDNTNKKVCMQYYEDIIRSLKIIIEQNLNEISINNNEYHINEEIKFICQHINYDNHNKYSDDNNSIINYNIDINIEWISANISMYDKNTYNYVLLSNIKINDAFYEKYMIQKYKNIYKDDPYISFNVNVSNLNKKIDKYHKCIFKIIMFINIQMSEIHNFFIFNDKNDYYHILLFNDVQKFINNNIDIFQDVDIEISISKIIYLNMLFYSHLSDIMKYIDNTLNNN